MHEALKESMTDTTIKERYFLTPNVYSQVAMGHSRSDSWRSRSPPGERGWNADRGRDYEKGKGKSRKGGGKSKGKKGASSCMIVHQMADRYAGGGTTLASDVASTAAGCTYVRLASVPIQSMHVTAAANRRTRQEEPRKGAASQPDGTRRWAKPRAHRSKEAQRGAHVREGR